MLSTISICIKVQDHNLSECQLNMMSGWAGCQTFVVCVCAMSKLRLSADVLKQHWPIQASRPSTPPPQLWPCKQGVHMI